MHVGDIAAAAVGALVGNVTAVAALVVKVADAADATATKKSINIWQNLSHVFEL